MELRMVRGLRICILQFHQTCSTNLQNPMSSLAFTHTQFIRKLFLHLSPADMQQWHHHFFRAGCTLLGETLPTEVRFPDHSPFE